MYNFCALYVCYCLTVYNVRVQFSDQVKYLGVLLNASLKDDDNIETSEITILRSK